MLDTNIFGDGGTARWYGATVSVKTVSRIDTAVESFGAIHESVSAESISLGTTVARVIGGVEIATAIDTLAGTGTVGSIGGRPSVISGRYT